MLDQVDFAKIAALNFTVPIVTSDPAATAADEGRIIYNTTANALKYCNETPAWITLGAAGAGVSDTRAILSGGGMTGGGDLSQDRTLTVVSANADMTVNADDITINSAPKWTTSRTITLSGDISWSIAGVDSSAAINMTNTAIGAGLIVNNDVTSAAAIQTSKISGLDTALSGKALGTTDFIAGNGLTGGGTLASSRTFDVVGGTGITANANDVAINLTYADARWLLLSGGTLTNFLTLHADPTSDMQAANKRYVDITSQGFSFKSAVRAVATTQRALSALTATDGVTLAANDRVLLAGQTAPAENGIWVAQSGAWARATDMDASGELKDGTLVTVAEGTAGADSQWMCISTTATPWVPGSSGSSWTRYTSLTDLTAGAGLTKTGNQIDVVSANADLTVQADTITIVSAPKWTTSRTLNLTGDVTGSVSFDGGSAIGNLVTTAVGGTKHYAANVGAGTAVVINHALNTRDVNVEIYRNSTPWDTVQATVERTDVNNVTLRFATAVGANAFRCVVTGK